MAASVKPIQYDRAIPTAAIYAQQFHGQLVDALRALQLMLDRAEVERPHHPSREFDELVQALKHGGIHITCGQLRAMVFKQRAREPSCKRR